jgi:hypothetical protein
MRRVNTGSNLIGKLAMGFAAAALLMVAPGQASAAKFKVLHSFCGKANCPDGSGPVAPLVRDAAGNLFGTTTQNGKNQFGAAFELVNEGNGKYNFKTLVAFPTNNPSVGGLIVDTAGNLYGWTRGRSFFKLSYGFGAHHDKWGMTEISLNCAQQPCSGTNPTTPTYAGAASGAPWDGASPLYGTMGGGGANNGGAVYRIVPSQGSWNYSELYEFCAQQNCADGGTPSGVLLDQSGVLYGTTYYGGCSSSCNIDSGPGVAFQLASSGGSWTETLLHTFCSESGCADGEHPTANLAQDAAGDLIGVTGNGGGAGKHQGGTLFKIIPNGAQSQETVLYDFCQRRDCKDGAGPEGTPLLDQAGNIFGTTLDGGGNEDEVGGAGIAYELSGTTFRVLHSFCSQLNCADGAFPSAGLIADGNGHLDGTAGGGRGLSEGTVFQLTP